MSFPRAAGIILHPSSLPGFGGIGSLGQEARAFVDLLVEAGVSLWQVLPLGPTGYGDSPYASLSAFAGNPLLIDLDPLVAGGLLDPEDLRPLNDLPTTHVDFGRVVPGKMAVLRRSFDRFPNAEGQADAVARFREANISWLDDLALYMAIKDDNGGSPWNLWPAVLRDRDPAALEAAKSRLAHEIEFHYFVQWLFFQQWDDLKRYANGRGVRIIGDIPIFVAYDSADVWGNQELFQLDESGAPLVVAGVPPDYFSATGQLWGNPHYRWDVLQNTGFRWWVDRFRLLLRLVDIVRLDHFRGFAAAWAVPYGEQTAVRGEWIPAPGEALFSAIRDALGSAPIIAEDLGVITPDVDALRQHFGFPGMKILQFAFSSDFHDDSLPHTYEANTVVYSGTHDNDTTVGWFSTATAEERRTLLTYTASDGFDVAWSLIRLAYASVANQALVPLQDVLRLGPAARMNLPGRPDGNWSWRYITGAITPEHVRSLRALTDSFGRSPGRNV